MALLEGRGPSAPALAPNALPPSFRQHYVPNTHGVAADRPLLGEAESTTVAVPTACGFAQNFWGIIARLRKASMAAYRTSRASRCLPHP